MYSPTFPENDVIARDFFTLSGNSANIASLPKFHSDSVIKHVLGNEENEPNLVGDFSRPHCLPTMPGEHSDLQCISPSVMAALLQGQLSNCVQRFVVVDCRYPYEYDGGHIKDAINIWQRDSLLQEFFHSDKHTKSGAPRPIVILHCEFSSERGPKMLRYLRQVDRAANSDCYPSLYYPEVYLMDGGYKAFYTQHKQLCVPQQYKAMVDQKHSQELKRCRAKSKCRGVNKTSSRSLFRSGPLRF